MKIVICGSISAHKKMSELFSILDAKGHSVIMPSLDYANIKMDVNGNHIETPQVKIENDLIKKYFKYISESDSILVVNQTKNGIEGYIGANTFLEIGFAHVLNKTIYLLNPYSKDSPYVDEINAIEMVILNGDITRILES